MRDLRLDITEELKGPEEEGRARKEAKPQPAGDVDAASDEGSGAEADEDTVEGEDGLDAADAAAIVKCRLLVAVSSATLAL